jgi:hypothetical protein
VIGNDEVRPADAAREGGWVCEALGAALPTGLPFGALTLVVLPDRGGLRVSAWSTLVGQVFLEALDRLDPVVYSVGGAPERWDPMDGWNPLGPHYAEVWDWASTSDPWAEGQPGAARPGWKSRLDGVRAVLREHEQRFGPSMTVLDNVGTEWPSVHAGLLPDGSDAARGELGGGAEREVWEWACGLSTFASERRDAPTVVVWQRPFPLEPTREAALRAVSAVVIEADATTPLLTRARQRVLAARSGDIG